MLLLMLSQHQVLLPLPPPVLLLPPLLGEAASCPAAACSLLLLDLVQHHLPKHSSSHSRGPIFALLLPPADCRCVGQPCVVRQARRSVSPVAQLWCVLGVLVCSGGP